MSIGAMFAGWIMHSTGKYISLSLTFGILPFIATMLIATINENSSPAKLWLSIIPFGLGISVVYQAMTIALLAHIPQSAVAVGTGFRETFGSVGQVGGVAISSAVFQSVLDSELRKRIHGPDAKETIGRIRESATLVISLPPGLQRAARDSYDRALKSVFVVATCLLLIAYIVRLPIPDKSLDGPGPAEPPSNGPQQSDVENTPGSASFSLSDDEGFDERTPILGAKVRKPSLKQRRGLPSYEFANGGMDPEDEITGDTAQRK